MTRSTQFLGQWFRLAWLGARPQSSPRVSPPESPSAALPDADGLGVLERMGLLARPDPRPTDGSAELSLLSEPSRDALERMALLAQPAPAPSRGLAELSLTAGSSEANPTVVKLSRRGTLIAFALGALTLALAAKGVDMVIFWGTTQCALWAIRSC
jgi:hypothetical protein